MALDDVRADGTSQCNVTVGIHILAVIVARLQRRNAADPWKKLAASRVRVLAAHDALHKGRNHGLKDHE